MVRPSRLLAPIVGAAAVVFWVNLLGVVLRRGEMNGWQYAWVAVLAAGAFAVWRLYRSFWWSATHRRPGSAPPPTVSAPGPAPPPAVSAPGPGWGGYYSDRHYNRDSDRGYNRGYDHQPMGNRDDYRSRDARMSREYASIPAYRIPSASEGGGPGEWVAIVVGIVLLLAVGVGAILFVMNLPRLIRGAIAYNLYTSAALVLLLMIWTLRPAVLKRQTWKLLSDVWLKLPTLSAFGFMAFGAIAAVGTLDTTLLRNGLAYSQVSAGTLGILYAAAVGLLGVSFLATMAGKASSSEDTCVPLWMFVVALASAWLGNFGAYTLFIDGVILTLYAHLEPI